MYRFAVITALLIAAVGGIIAPAAAGVAAAQEDAADEKSTNSQEDTVLHELKEDGETEPGAIITDITWDGRTVEITVHANDYTTLSVNDAGIFNAISEGSSEEIAYETYTIPSGQTRTIEFTVAAGTGVKAVSITGHGTMIGAVEDSAGIISGSATWAEVQAGAIGGIMFGSGIPLAVTGIIAIAGNWKHQRVF